MSKVKKESIEFLSTHPSSTTRIANIKKAISKIEKTQNQTIKKPIINSNMLGNKIN
jgi:predicted Zn-dependent protease